MELQKLLEDYLEYLKNNNFAKSTIKNRKYILTHFVEAVDIPIRELTLRDYDNYLSYRRQAVNKRGEQITESTVNYIKKILRHFFEYCQDYRGIQMQFDHTMVRTKRDPKAEIKYLRPEDVQLAMQVMKNDQDRLITAVMFETGLRIGEVVQLKAEDIYAGEIRVIGKGHRPDVLPIHEELERALQTHILEHKITRGHIFRHLKHQNTGKDYYATDTVRKRLKAAFKQVGIEMHPHMLRHGYATYLLRQKADMRTIQTLMRHQSLETTMLYTHVTNDHLRESYRRCFTKSLITVSTFGVN